MGFIHVNVGLSNASDLDSVEEVRVLVDTGATLSVFPASVLEKMGIRRTSQRRFRGFGGVVTRDIGAAMMHYEGENAAVAVVFGDEGDPAIMGVTALETLGYHVNPVDGDLRRVEMLL